MCGIGRIISELPEAIYATDPATKNYNINTSLPSGTSISTPIEAGAQHTMTMPGMQDDAPKSPDRIGKSPPSAAASTFSTIALGELTDFRESSSAGLMRLAFNAKPAKTNKDKNKKKAKAGWGVNNAH